MNKCENIYVPKFQALTIYNLVILSWCTINLIINQETILQQFILVGLSLKYPHNLVTKSKRVASYIKIHLRFSEEAGLPYCNYYT